MRKYVTFGAVLALPFLMGANSGCQDNENKFEQAKLAQQAANSITFTDNTEIANIKRRIELTSKPGILGFIILMNEAGQPIMYEGVVGKVTSGGKRLTQPDRIAASDKVMTAPSDEGTWGSSGEYIFYWNTEGAYRQWNGKFLYSDRPLRLRVEPLVVSIQSSDAQKR